MKKTIGRGAALLAVMFTILAGCVDTDGDDTRIVRDTIVDTVVKIVPASELGAAITDPGALPVTLPVLDAFFADSSFAADLQRELQLTPEQIEQLRRVARDETARLGDSATGGEWTGSTEAARRLAAERINGVIGEEKGRRLAELIRKRWGGDAMAGADSTGGAMNDSVPSDTRIVVNTPAYRMDVFQDGKLVKSYKVSIGYPEFPIPVGNRAAKTIIFNPTWTPPDEPWVEGSKNAKPGVKIAAGSKDNPLGVAKIPIGLPSLIHGGKTQGQLGSFGSHGCVGLTDAQMRDFSLLLAKIAGSQLADSTLDRFKKNGKQTQTVELGRSIPVELRYQTMMAQDGKLYLYRDVYDRNTNTEENLRAYLARHGVTLEQLTEAERTKVMEGLRSMSRDATGSSDSSSVAADTAKGKSGKDDRKITRTVKGAKEVVIPIAALKGKGYPAPVLAAR